jgi:hypothetical protein
MTAQKQQATQEQAPAAKQAPAFVIYEVVERGGKKYWNRVGAAFRHGKGDGLNLVYNNGARQVMLPPKDKAEDITEATAEAGA